MKHGMRMALIVGVAFGALMAVSGDRGYTQAADPNAAPADPNAPVAPEGAPGRPPVGVGVPVDPANAPGMITPKIGTVKFFSRAESDQADAVLHATTTALTFCCRRN